MQNNIIPLKDKPNRACLQCGTQLSGRQKMYCSRLCKNTYNNHYFQSYISQQKRGRDRKLMLIEKMGSACSICGYDRNFAALEFHHTEPSKKLFQLDLRSLSNRKWEAIEDEVKKCRLLCSNCHTELHNSDCFLGNTK